MEKVLKDSLNALDILLKSYSKEEFKEEMKKHENNIGPTMKEYLENKFFITPTIVNDLLSNDILPILVGGSVRDKIIDHTIISKDIDIELYTSKSYDDIIQILEKFNYKCDLVGKSFGVIKVTLDNGDDYDISLPRTEKSVGNKHTDFEVIPDGTLSFKEAFKRRDFTFNAIGYNYKTNEFIDEYNGIEDLQNKIIKHVDNKTFVEDPLRIYRAIQFAARFNFNIHPNTKDLIHNMIKNGLLDHLPKERIFTEFNKLLTKSKKPSIGFELMKEFGILEKYFPELFQLKNIPQSPKWHPEGNVWIHTMMVIDQMANLDLDKDKLNNKLLYMYATLCHDLGKKEYTQFKEDGTITSQGHEEGGIKPTIEFMDKLTNDKRFIKQICSLVEHHLKPTLLYTANSKKSAIKRLSNKLLENNVDLKDLAIINKADSLGRTTKDALAKETPQYDWLLQKIEDVGIDKEKPLISGKELIEKGLKPGPFFKEILNEMYEYQLENDIQDFDTMYSHFENQINELYSDSSIYSLN